MSDAASASAPITRWDRAAIVALGTAGCALSYDALQQMATAIHIRGFLTFVFPLVIDGFIAYGVRALLVLRAAPLAARCYVWMLFGTATAASIWANALHAVRLNQQQPEGDGLHLGDATVGVLSTLAPLALAGAVHLYILIARRVTETELSAAPGNGNIRTARITAVRQDTVSEPAPLTGGHLSADASRLTVAQDADAEVSKPADEVSAHPQDTPAEPEPEQHVRAADLAGQPNTRPRPVTLLHPAKPSVTTSDTVRGGRADTSSRKVTALTDEDLLTLARPAVTETGRLTRKVVGDAIRSHGHGLSNDRLTELMDLLRTEADQPDDARTG
ncbi:DUF2637 domain-containing protein [Streptomyces sp. SID5785]|uniref:DUF2637 domain-containing protein n=1 Tax=Streptomyces sp. SID5785 TaxID=2690309 RepID=UPI001361BBD0|nr:DUF2637 domain-containing protein [Streptomyces sp. SID5785]